MNGILMFDDMFSYICPGCVGVSKFGAVSSS